LCAIGIDTDTGYWYVFYGGKSDGSETFLTSINVYYKVSTDAGATWGPETLLTPLIRNIKSLVTTPRFTGQPGVRLFITAVPSDAMRYIASTRSPRASFQLGL